MIWLSKPQTNNTQSQYLQLSMNMQTSKKSWTEPLVPKTPGPVQNFKENSKRVNETRTKQWMSDTEWQKGTLYLPAKVCQDFANRAMVPEGALAAHDKQFVCKSLIAMLTTTVAVRSRPSNDKLANIFIFWSWRWVWGSGDYCIQRTEFLETTEKLIPNWRTIG